MTIKDFYPIDFNGTVESFNSLIRTLLIRANYDSILKKVTKYKGMHQFNGAHECWTIKIDGIDGIYGLSLSSLKDKENSYEGELSLYYFPSPFEKNIYKSSLLEEYIASDEQYIEKVKSFSSFLELYLNFKIAKLVINISKEEDDFSIKYEIVRRIKTFAKDGVEDVSNITNHEYIINKNEIDKNFPAFRFTLPFFNFFNTLLTRIGKKGPVSFEINKRKINTNYYDKEGIISENPNVLSSEIILELNYSSKESKDKSSRENSNLYNILTKGTWVDYYLDLSKFHEISNKGLKPKLIIITGFLGSGKTNFLQNFIEFENQNNRFIGIVQNEIGKTGLDGKLLDYDYNLVEIDEGCVCCSMAGQLKIAVIKLLEEKQADTIIVETTGVANPFNLLGEIDELSDYIEFDSIVTVVDASSYDELINTYTVFKDQIRAADVILLNKIDLVTKEQLGKIENDLKIQNRCASIIKTTNCTINPLIVSNNAQLNDTTGHIKAHFNEEVIHFRTHLEDNISSIKVNVDKKLDKNRLEEYLQNTPKEVLRVKGIVEFIGDESQYVVQYVNSTYEISELENRAKRENFLIYIGEDINGVEKIF